jgi:hypothetical protein
MHICWETTGGIAPVILFAWDPSDEKRGLFLQKFTLSSHAMPVKITTMSTRQVSYTAYGVIA